MKSEIKMSDIKEMWGICDERIGILLDSGDMYFVVEMKKYGQYLIGNFTKN